ncbi:MAG TPA: S8 family serine peptidase, partial [Terriglobia bacterium]|nr:S8 family serine peptidase [Terriglobia bacterium]
MKRVLVATLLLVAIAALTSAQSGGQDYIVTLQAGHSIKGFNARHGTQTIQQIPDTSTYLVRSNAPDPQNIILNQIQNDARVALAEKNSKISLQSAQVPLTNVLVSAMAELLDGQTLTTFYGTNVLKSYVTQPALSLIHVTDTRTISTGAGTRVAYIDTGVDPYHPALAPWLDPGVDVLNNTSTSEVDGLSSAMAELLDGGGSSLLDSRFFFALDSAMAELLDGEHDNGAFPPDFGHGTMVAGMIHIVAPNARIVPIKAFDPYGNTTMFNIISGVYAARNLGVDVLNMSFSTTQDSVTFRKAVTDAHAAGIAIVASAGNNAANSATYFPASYANVIGVAATDFNNRLASFS